MRLPLEGGCLCGRVRYRIEAAPHHADFCHCPICQRASGAPVVPWLTMASRDFVWTAGKPAVYRSTPGAERLFCPHCGTPLVAELVHGTRASTRDPARFAFAHGGKDGTPFPVDRHTYDQTIELLRGALGRASIDHSDRSRALRRLAVFANNARPSRSAPSEA